MCCTTEVLFFWGLFLVTDEYNEHLVFNPEDSKLFFSIREPIVNRVFSNSRQRGFASR